MNAYDVIPQYSKMLQNLERWLDKAATHGEQKNFDVETLLHARLAPDMYPLTRQIQSACDTAKFSACYLTGRTPPVHPDTEKTIAELRARVQSVRSFLETIKPEEVAGGEERKVSPKWLGGKWVRGDHFLLQMSIPNFYFHVTTAYDILRHNGVDVGKQDFIGSFPIRD